MGCQRLRRRGSASPFRSHGAAPRAVRPSALASAASNSASVTCERFESNAHRAARVYSASAASPRGADVRHDDGRRARAGWRHRAVAGAAQQRRDDVLRRASTSRGCRAAGSCEHLLDRQHQHGARARGLQAFERLPEHVFAAHGVHRHLVAGAVERDDRRRLAARQQLRDLRPGPSAARAA